MEWSLSYLWYTRCKYYGFVFKMLHVIHDAKLRAFRSLSFCVALSLSLLRSPSLSRIPLIQSQMLYHWVPAEISYTGGC